MALRAELNRSTYASPSSSESSDLARFLGFFAGAFFVATLFVGASFLAAVAGGGLRDSSRLEFTEASSSSEETSPPARARSSSSTSDMVGSDASLAWARNRGVCVAQFEDAWMQDAGSEAKNSTKKRAASEVLQRTLWLLLCRRDNGCRRPTSAVVASRYCPPRKQFQGFRFRIELVRAAGDRVQSDPTPGPIHELFGSSPKCQYRCRALNL